MKILIADDHTLFREALRQVVRQLDDNVTVLEAHDWNAAVEMGKQNPDIALALVDLKMPGMQEFAGLDAFLLLTDTVPVVVVSASESVFDMQRVFDAGAMGFIAKNETMDVFLSALRLVLSGGFYVPQKLIQRPVSVESRQDGAALFGLTPRQFEVLKAMMHGLSNKEIANRLNLSEVTVKVHISAIFKSLNVTNRLQAIQLAQNLI
jgi:DNA-binding NarL/FixJ family response regulator